MASSVINEIFERALISIREELSAKEFKQVTTPTGLPDVLKVAEDVLKDRSSRTHPKGIKAFEALEKARLHLEPFENLLEGLAMLAPFGGKLIWGSVKTVFQFVEKSNEGLTRSSRSSPSWVRTYRSSTASPRHSTILPWSGQ